MALWYRTHHSKNLQYVFSGEGGLFVCGRWNHIGKKAIYCSESIALATIEWLSHNGLSVSGFNYYRYSINIPDDMIKNYKAKDLPKNWNATPSIEATRTFADKFLFASHRPLAISIPSVVVPEEKNLIINPLHPDFTKVYQSIVNLGRFTSPIR